MSSSVSQRWLARRPHPNPRFRSEKAHPNALEIQQSVSTREEQIRVQRAKYRYDDAGEYR